MLARLLTLLTLTQTYLSFRPEQNRTTEPYIYNPLRADPKICQGNRFKHISTYSLGSQNDLSLTFGRMQTQTKVDKVVYKDEPFRTYTIFPLEMVFSYADRNQKATPVGTERLKISGGTLRINYTFAWEKKQLSSSIEGTAKGVVTTDPITFIKSLDINQETRLLEWNFVSAENITITNSLTVNDFKPYKEADFDVIRQMLNELKSGDPTVKSKLVAALNANFTKILSKIVHDNNDTWKQPSAIRYSYSDYHGDYNAEYSNTIMGISLARGLDITLSQVNQNDSKFQCGEKVPEFPENETKYGGIQEFISNAYVKSILRNVINKGNLDVRLTEQFWQSPAFQFYMGDLHEVMPSTRNISSMEPITGLCRALDDKYFNLSVKSTKSYLVSVNFTCDLKIFNGTKRLIGLNLAVDYEVGVVLLTNTLDFTVRSITGTPTFFQEEDFKIKNMDLTLFMIEQTLNMARNVKVVGTGFKTMSRKFPGLEVRDKYLFLFDSSAKSTQKLQNLIDLS